MNILTSIKQLVPIVMVIGAFFIIGTYLSQMNIFPTTRNSSIQPTTMIIPTQVVITPTDETLQMVASIFISYSESERQAVKKEWGIDEDSDLIYAIAKKLEYTPAEKALWVAYYKQMNTLRGNNAALEPIQTNSQGDFSTTQNDLEDKLDCQKEWSEYNTCQSEKNEAMNEYSTCLAESSNPDNYKYGSYCSKPYNYYKNCFKPFCSL